MDEKLKKHHESVINLYAEAYSYFSQINKNDGKKESLRTQLSKWLTLANQNRIDEIYINVNKESVNRHRNATKNHNGVIKDSSFKRIEDEINEKIENIKKRKIEIEKIAKKHMTVETLLNGRIIKRMSIDDSVVIKDDDIYCATDYILLKGALNKYYNEKSKEYQSPNIQNNVKSFVERYKTLIFNFNRSKGKGWYDYFGEYRFSNIKSQNDFEEGLRALKEKGYDIIELKKEKSANDMVVVILTNSGNVSAIHDIVYQECNHKKITIEGRFLVPVFNQEFDINIINSNENTIEAYKNYKTAACNMIPEILRTQFLSSIDAYSIGKGIPQLATLTSSYGKTINGRTKRIHVYDKDPTKMAKQIVDSMNEQNNLDSFLNDKLEQSRKLDNFFKSKTKI